MKKLIPFVLSLLFIACSPDHDQDGPNGTDLPADSIAITPYNSGIIVYEEFLDHGHYTINTIDWVTGIEKKIFPLEADSIYCRFPRFDRASKRVFFTSRNSYYGNSDIFSMTSNGSDIRNHSQTTDVNETMACPSPDGKSVVFTSETPDREFITLSILNLVSGEQQELLRWNYIEPDTRYVDKYLFWSRDGNSIFFNANITGIKNSVQRFDLNTKKYTTLTPDNNSYYVTNISPTEDKLLLCRIVTGSCSLYAMDYAGNNLHAVSNVNLGNAVEAAWTPDGKSIIGCIQRKPMESFQYYYLANDHQVGQQIGETKNVKFSLDWIDP
ncbi:TolB family protein [Flavihumibacter petaseus]|uniref:TolB protein n=1 Tax=Flavihumibacter petaseus NBRC 106054 TaxID=1220578 RepID=A0A0E9N4D4_9BACT|nr:PD40 domain-containing protein [Flavihumibacter petaseus]GAO44521.1 hypothetical protein FPE01S_03_05580 [Flavihumibacter petaseus NBRC 106054]